MIRYAIRRHSLSVVTAGCGRVVSTRPPALPGAANDVVEAWSGLAPEPHSTGGGGACGKDASAPHILLGGVDQTPRRTFRNVVRVAV